MSPDTHSKEQERSREDLERPALLFSLSESSCEEGTRLPASLLGGVSHQEQGEEWPQAAGVPLLGLFQLDLRELPFKPKAFRNTEFLSLFVHPDKAPSSGGCWLLRTYKRAGELTLANQGKGSCLGKKLSPPLLVADLPISASSTTKSPFPAAGTSHTQVKLGGYRLAYPGVSHQEVAKPLVQIPNLPYPFGPWQEPGSLCLAKSDGAWTLSWHGK